MDHTQVVIVGAGPSGLTMGLALAKHGVQSVILEQRLAPDPDPKGVYLNGDAVRILWSLGLRDSQFTQFAGEPEAVHFYKTCITNDSGTYFVMRTDEDFLHQALQNGVTHVQPQLESAIADAASASGYCEVRRGCTVLSHKMLHDHRIVITYQSNEGGSSSIACSYLIGADGKRGAVRKEFLEPTTSIRHVSNPVYQYEGTWIAANLQLSLPTVETHPEFPLWALGYTPQAVYDLFCPKAWYFCSPPGKPSAGGRFGPEQQMLWRHEFAQPDWSSAIDAEELFWEHFIPFITRTRDAQRRPLPCGAVTYPCDCIKVLRCRAFTFTHKVVTKWFDRRRILIGDAAHVFPPFGGQGIASGMRDAHQLAWRMALLESMPNVDNAFADTMLEQWARERRKSVDGATFQTKMNGTMCNEPESWAFYLFRKFRSLYEKLPLVPPMLNPVVELDRRGFKGVQGGFFLPEYDGGGKFPQVFARRSAGDICRSDDIFAGHSGILKLVALHDDAALIEAARRLLNTIGLPPTLLNSRLTILADKDVSRQNREPTDQLLSPIVPPHNAGMDVRQGYQHNALREWLGPSTVFALLRCDFHIFAVMRGAEELEDALEKLQMMWSMSRPPLAKL